MGKHIERGDVFWVNLDPTVGSEIKKHRPCAVLTVNPFNDVRRTVVVMPLSTAVTPHPPLVVAVPSAGKTSTAKIDQLRAVDKSRFTKHEGKLSSHDMHAIEHALKTVLGL